MDKKLRLKKINLFEIKETKYITHLQEGEIELSKIQTQLRNLRIVKTKDGWDIICDCKNEYSSKRDPNAYSKDNRPQCPKCGTRVKRKEPVKRTDVSKRLKKMHKKERQ